MAWVGVGKENVKMEVTAGSGKKMQHKWEWKGWAESGPESGNKWVGQCEGWLKHASVSYSPLIGLHKYSHYGVCCYDFLFFLNCLVGKWCFDELSHFLFRKPFWNLTG
jgi:hypothetical protein